MVQIIILKTILEEYLEMKKKPIHYMYELRECRCLGELCNCMMYKGFLMEVLEHKELCKVRNGV